MGEEISSGTKRGVGLQEYALNVLKKNSITLPWHPTLNGRGRTIKLSRHKYY